ncbi:hypothetical protein T06_1926, partial [Trichinella sp. T6]
RICFISFPVAPTKITPHSTFIAISRQIRIHVTRFCKVLRQINRYVSNKWPLKLPCAYLNTQGSRHTGTPLIRIQGIRSLGICCSIFRCFGQLDFPSFSDHFE